MTWVLVGWVGPPFLMGRSTTITGYYLATRHKFKSKLLVKGLFLLEKLLNYQLRRFVDD